MAIINHNINLCTPSAGPQAGSKRLSSLHQPNSIFLQRRTRPSPALADVAAMMLGVPHEAKSLAVHGLSKLHLRMYWRNLTADIGDVEQVDTRLETAGMS